MCMRRNKMSRKIKFRFWADIEERYVSNCAVCGDGSIMVYDDTFIEDVFDGEIIAEQFTGFTDIDGNPVYQGDVVVDSYDRKMAVVFREHKQTLEFKALTKTNFKYALIQGWVNNQDGSAGDMAARVKIIGNIHEHKHLLED